VASAVSGARAHASASPAQPDSERRRAFLKRAVREQYIPLAGGCYEELLTREPKAKGKMVFAFSIVGDEDTGGVVDTVELKEESEIKDPEFVLCVRESLYGTIFEPPPDGARETTVVYPIEFGE
jgi:hypothetical protein